MRFLTGLLTVLGLLFGGYWLAGSTAVDRGAATLAEQMHIQGWTLQYGAIETTGFPVRFDTMLTDLSVADAAGLFGWQGPSLRLYAQTFWPARINADLPDHQVLQIGDQQLTVSGQNLQASVTALARPSLPLDEIAINGELLRVKSDLGWEITLETAKALFVAIEPARYHLFVEGWELALPAALIVKLDPENRLPGTVERMILDLSLDFDRPLDRFAGDGSGPRITVLNLRDFNVFWGDTGITANGQLTIDDTGTPTGEITVIGVNWRQLIALAVNAGFLAPGAAPTWERIAEALAQGDNIIEGPLTFQNGFISLGPIPLGPAPRF